MITKSLYAKNEWSPRICSAGHWQNTRCRNCLADDLLLTITLTHHRWGAFLLGLLEEKIVYILSLLKKRGAFTTSYTKTEGEHHSQGCKSPIHHIWYMSVRRPEPLSTPKFIRSHRAHTFHVHVFWHTESNKPHLLVDDSQSGRLTC